MARFVVTLYRSSPSSSPLASLGDYATNDRLFFTSDKRYGCNKVEDPYEARILYVDMPEEAVERLKRDEMDKNAAKALKISIQRHLSEVSESGWYQCYGRQGYLVSEVIRAT